MTTKTTREIAEDFYRISFVEGDIVRAVETHVSPDTYIQHNPNIGDGRDAALAMLKAAFTGDAARSMSMECKRLLVDGDVFCFHLHWKPAPDHPGFAIAEFFRVEDGKIVEHWDVMQTVPTDSPNPKAMF